MNNKLQLLTTVFIAILLYGCHKDKTDYTSAVAGSYQWHHYAHSITYIQHVKDTAFFYPDITMPIGVYDRKTIFFHEQYLSYKSASDSELIFAVDDGGNVSTTLTYKKISGKIKCITNQHHSAAHNTSEVFESF